MQITIGQQFRQFRIVASVGEGGMGVVYRAHDERLDRPVALKFLTEAGASDDEFAERLRREARALAALNHPNIVTIHEIGDHDGMPFLVLEWIDGVPLDDPSMPRPMPPEEFLPLAIDIAAALGCAHAGGVVHRDLKPANVLVTPAGRAVLLDFGIARRDRVDVAITASGSTLGTIAYMSPEQVRGEPVGPPSDIFAFGTLAYQLLSGTLPFSAPGAGALMLAIVDGSHPPLGERRPELPVALTDLVERCLAPSPDDRFADGTALLEALEAVARGEAVPTARPATAPPPLEQEIRLCRTADGVQIAYAVIGSGPPLVRVLGHFTHLELEWQWPEMRLLWEELARHHTVVRYDGRGTGMSDPWREEFTEETRQRDLDAVLHAVDAGPATLLGISEGGWTAARYANDHPDRVAALILYGAYCRGARARPNFDPEENEAMLTLIAKGWGRDTPAFRQLFTSQFFLPDADPRVLGHFNDLQRASADGDTARRYHDSCHRRGDGEAMFRAVRVPTLVVHANEDRITEAVEGRLLASVIPNARLIMLPSYGHYFPVDRAGVTRVVEAFNTLLRPERSP